MLASNTNLVLNAVPIASGQYLWKGFPVLTKNWTFLEFICIFKEVKGKFSILNKILIFFHGFAVFPQVWPLLRIYNWAQKSRKFLAFALRKSFYGLLTGKLKACRLRNFLSECTQYKLYIFICKVLSYKTPCEIANICPKFNTRCFISN